MSTSLQIELEDENALASPTIKVIKGRRKRATVSPDLTVIIEVKDGGETFEDKMTLRGSVPTKSYATFMRIQDLFSVEEGEEIEPSEDLFNEMFTLFPDFLMPMIKGANFEVTHESIDEMDSNIKFALFNLIQRSIDIPSQAEDATKK